MDYEDFDEDSTGRGRHWVFTLNNPEDHGIVDNHIPALPQERYIVWQLEQGGRTGTLHIQGYVEFHASIRFNALKAWLPSARFAMRKGSRDQAREYCMKKDETYRAGPWERGEYDGGECLDQSE